MLQRLHLEDQSSPVRITPRLIPCILILFGRVLIGCLLLKYTKEGTNSDGGAASALQHSCSSSNLDPFASNVRLA